MEKLLLGKPYEEHTTKNTLSLYWNLLSKEITSFKLISEALKKHSIRSASTKITFAASFFYNAFLGSEDLSHKEILSNSALSAVATYSALFIGGLVLGAISKGKETKNLDKVLGSNWHLSHKGKNQNAGLEKLILKEVLEEELAIKGKILTEEEKEQELKYLKSYLALFSALPCESYMKNFSCDFSIAQGWLDLPPFTNDDTLGPSFNASQEFKELIKNTRGNSIKRYLLGQLTLKASPLTNLVNKRLIHLLGKELTLLNRKYSQKKTSTTPRTLLQYILHKIRGENKTTESTTIAEPFTALEFLVSEERELGSITRPSEIRTEIEERIKKVFRKVYTEEAQKAQQILFEQGANQYKLPLLTRILFDPEYTSGQSLFGGEFQNSLYNEYSKMKEKFSCTIFSKQTLQTYVVEARTRVQKFQKIMQDIGIDLSAYPQGKQDDETIKAEDIRALGIAYYTQTGALYEDLKRVLAGDKFRKETPKEFLLPQTNKSSIKNELEELVKEHRKEGTVHKENVHLRNARIYHLVPKIHLEYYRKIIFEKAKYAAT
ncbi:MAG: hypothetical protein H6500_00005 [Candidatus Woesearchaeota archaeon]|nr:MAG: hypothetical protein H6500_00005 [Candidatus Woesearchaeota archaeon]